MKKWEEDLEGSREMSEEERGRVRFVVGWFLGWAGKVGVEGNVEAGRRFWREVVLSKEREGWMLEQWAAGLRWLWRWQELGGCEDAAGRGRLVERVKRAVWTTGARRGLALRTRETYAGWCGRFADWCGDEREVMREERAREWLGELVSNEAVAYATQKQALNALVFFFRDVCGREEVDLGVRLRKTAARIPVVLDRAEIGGLFKQLDGDWRLMAQVMYGSGLRLT